MQLLSLILVFLVLSSKRVHAEAQSAVSNFFDHTHLILSVENYHWIVIVLLLLLVGLLVLNRFLILRQRARTLLEEEKYRMLFENMALGVFYQQADGRYIDVNESALEMLGVSRDQFLGRTSMDSSWKVIREDGTRISGKEHPSIKALQTGRPIYNEIVGINNLKKMASVWLSIDATPQFREGELRPYQVFVTMYDISKRLLAEKEMLRSEMRLRTLVDTIPDLIWLKDQDGYYLFCNPYFERLFGAKEEEIVGKTDFDFVDKELAEFFRDNDRRAVEAGVPKVNEEWLTFAEDGYHGLFETIKSPVFDGNGHLMGVLGIARDITVRTRAEKENLLLEGRLKQAEKIEAIGNLAGGIAHDFNNILSSILGYTELALLDVEKGTPLEESLQEVFSAGNRAADLVRQILTFARGADESTGPVCFASVVREVVKFIRSSTPTTIEIKQTLDSSSNVMGNSTRLHQVIMNLCTNSVYAMLDQGGVLEVDLKDITIDSNMEIEGILLAPGDYVELVVADTGSGIEAEVMDSIFEPYFTTKRIGEGIGMGLATVKGVVESYGGKIHVYSIPEERTAFSLWLPILAESEQNDVNTENIALPTGTERILLVDDEVQITRMGCRILEQKGYKVTPASGSVEAIALFSQKPASFDLLITDMTMPVMTGDRLIVELRKIRPELPVILLTGYSSTMSEERAAELNIDAFAYKPFIGTDIITTVRQVLQRDGEELI